MNTPTKTALRAALQQEGEALASRLPDPADALAVAPAVAETVVPPAPPVLEPVPAAASPVAAVSAEVVKPAPKRAAAGSSAKAAARPAKAVASAKVK
ncbi:MAG: hypothetical protein PHD22_11145, partial [Zoogloea sp.]|nr:hypothetical protein [Zoogloea sp.]